MKILLKMCDISSSICSSPIGHLLITYCPNGLHSVCQTSDITDKTFRVDEKLIFSSIFFSL